MEIIGPLPPPGPIPPPAPARSSGARDGRRAAREMHGIGSLQEIRYAVLERNGKISIVPTE